MTLWVDTDEQNGIRQALIEEIDLVKSALIEKMMQLHSHLNYYYTILIKD